MQGSWDRASRDPEIQESAPEGLLQSLTSIRSWDPGIQAPEGLIDPFEAENRAASLDGGVQGSRDPGIRAPEGLLRSLRFIRSRDRGSRDPAIQESETNVFSYRGTNRFNTTTSNFFFPVLPWLQGSRDPGIQGSRNPRQRVY